jgi:hypothetical protein
MPTYRASEPTDRPDFVSPGEYDLEVIDASETVSRNGHDMIELKLRTANGCVFYDFLVFTKNAFWKIDSFRAAIGEEVSSGEEVEVLADDLIGRSARARLVVEEFKGRKRNKVAAWLAPAARPASANSTSDRASSMGGTAPERRVAPSAISRLRASMGRRGSANGAGKLCGRPYMMPAVPKAVSPATRPSPKRERLWEGACVMEDIGFSVPA